MQNVFIIGSKGIPSSYGGFETFVDKLTEYHQDVEGIKYHVACKNIEENEYDYHNARCFNVKVPDIGPAQAIYYDVFALKKCCDYIKKNNITEPIIYILACRIGPFANFFQKKVHKFGGRVYVNPDGHEWMRAKWSMPVRKYWKYSEKMMVKHADLLICDSQNIEQYIKENYERYKPNTMYIAYGADLKRSKLNDDDPKLLSWYEKSGLQSKSYYLVVGRFVPENNYEIMIKEFMLSNSKRDFALITNVSEKFLDELKKKTNFHNDSRIKFVGTVYDQDLLKKIRENAYGYCHGHEVGGTNPSLLEALASTNLNLLLDVGFNREVAKDSGIYWTKERGNFSNLIKTVDSLNKDEQILFGKLANECIMNRYRWEDICFAYKQLFICTGSHE